MMKHLYTYLYAALLVLLVSACSSTKHLNKEASIDGLPPQAYMEEVIRRTPGWDAVTAKMSLSLTLDNKAPIRLGGSLRIKRDEVIQMSVTYLLGIEVGRMEISPDGMLVIDRLNKRYVKVSFDELKRLANADLDFHILQALFLNEVFLPGKGALTPNDASAFNPYAETDNVRIEVKKSKRFNYRFYTDRAEGQLKQSRIGLAETAYALNWLYDKFTPLDGKSFPGTMQVSFEGGKKPVSASFALSRLSTDNDWEKHTRLSGKYEQVALQDLLKLILKL